MQFDDTPSDVTLKLLLIGDSNVGKSSMLLRFCENKFSHSLTNTIGLDFKKKVVTIGDKQVKLQVWDTAGQERFRNITNAYMRGAHGILMVYDVTDEISFNHVKHWMDKIQEMGGNNHIILIGNKSDAKKRVITFERGQQLAGFYGIEFLETSALLGENITEAFMRLGEKSLGEFLPPPPAIVVQRKH